MLLQAAAYDTAYEDFSRAADMNPSNPEILQELVRAAGGSGREHEAITLLDRLSSTIPEEPVLYIARSRLLASLGSIDSAISAAEQALAMEPASLPAREHLAVVADRRRGRRPSRTHPALDGARRPPTRRDPLLRGGFRVPCDRTSRRP